MSNQAPQAAPSFVSTLPADLLAELTALCVVEYGIGAGPSFAMTQTWKPSGGISFEAALTELERHRGTFKRAHVHFDNGLRILFDPQGYLSHSTRTT